MILSIMLPDCWAVEANILYNQYEEMSETVYEKYTLTKRHIPIDYPASEMVYLRSAEEYKPMQYG